MPAFLLNIFRNIFQKALHLITYFCNIGYLTLRIPILLTYFSYMFSSLDLVVSPKMTRPILYFLMPLRCYFSPALLPKQMFILHLSVSITRPK